MSIYLIRHGQSESNANIDKGSDDLPAGPDWAVKLTDKGKQEAQDLYIDLVVKSGVKFDHIICSPYIRAVQTMEIFKTSHNKYFDVSVSVEYDSRIRERVVTIYDDIIKDFRNMYKMTAIEQYFWHNPHVESLASVCDRTKSFLLYLDTIKHKYENIAIFSHREAIKCLLHSQKGESPFRFPMSGLRNCEYTKIQ